MYNIVKAGDAEWIQGESTPEKDGIRRNTGAREKTAPDHGGQQEEETNLSDSEEREQLLRLAREEAQSITQEAEQLARDIVLKAQQEGASERAILAEQARKEGYAEGYNVGVSRALKEAQDAVNDFAELIADLKEAKRDELREQEKDLVLIAFELAKKIMRRQVTVDTEAIPKMLEEIIKENEQTIKIYLSEYNKTLRFRVDRKMYHRIKSLSDNLRVIVIADEGDSDDIIQVETETGMVDANIQSQLDNLKKELGVD